MGYGDKEDMKEELQENGEFFERDIYCPHCFDRQDICDVKEAHEEGECNSMQCESCGKNIEFDTRINICYYIRR